MTVAGTPVGLDLLWPARFIPKVLDGKRGRRCVIGNSEAGLSEQ